MEQRPSWESNTFTTSQEIPSLYEIRRFMAAFTRACHLSYPEPDQTSPCPHPTSWRFVLILFSHLYLGLTSGTSSSHFHHQNRICTRIVRHAPPISSCFDHPKNIWWAVQIIKPIVMKSFPIQRCIVPRTSIYNCLCFRFSCLFSNSVF